MGARSMSLRLRLLILILAPLLIMSVALGYWRYQVAQETADTLFDRALLATALAVSRDVVISEGDVLLPSTRDMIRDASGGEVFYHVTGPGGVYITGYGYPPAYRGADAPEHAVPTYYEAMYRQEPVRVLRIVETLTLDQVSGETIVTVWQRVADRGAFARELGLRAAGLLTVLLTCVAIVVWFGVRAGLRPLQDLQDAISIRSSDDLSQIRRPVPAEVSGIVATLNALFGQVRGSMTAHQDFIAEAAHQLRNPSAAVQAMAVAARKAKTEEDREQRLDELLEASRSAAEVTEQLLSLERLRHDKKQNARQPFNLNQVTREVCEAEAGRALAGGVSFDGSFCDADLTVVGDPVYVAEAIKNLIGNSMTHGGDGLSAIRVATERIGSHASVTVTDDGVGLSPEDREIAFSRFG